MWRSKQKVKHHRLFISLTEDTFLYSGPFFNFLCLVHCWDRYQIHSYRGMVHHLIYQFNKRSGFGHARVTVSGLLQNCAHFLFVGMLYVCVSTWMCCCDYPCLHVWKPGVDIKHIYLCLWSPNDFFFLSLDLSLNLEFSISGSSCLPIQCWVHTAWLLCIEYLNSGPHVCIWSALFSFL